MAWREDGVFVPQPQNRLAPNGVPQARPMMNRLAAMIPPELRGAPNRLAALAAFASNFTAPADVRDYSEGTSGALRNALAGKWGDAGAHALQGAGGGLGMILGPAVSGLGGFGRAMRATDDAMSAADAGRAMARPTFKGKTYFGDDIERIGKEGGFAKFGDMTVADAENAAGVPFELLFNRFLREKLPSVEGYKYFTMQDGRRLRVADHPPVNKRSRSDVYVTVQGNKGYVGDGVRHGDRTDGSTWNIEDISGLTLNQLLEMAAK